MGGLEALGAMLAASVALWAATRTTAPSREEVRATLRSALFFAWGTLVGEVLLGLGRGEALVASIPPLDGVVTASLAFGAAALVVTRLSPRRRAFGTLLAVSLVMGVERLVLDSLSASSALVVHATWAWLGLWLLRSMLERRHPVARAAMHAVAFGSTMVFFGPLAVIVAVGRAPAWPGLSPARLSIVSLLVMGALAVGIGSARAFARAGGTPDPLDSPPRLVTDGVYAHVRHPLQVAEAVLLSASAVAFWDRWVLVYAVVCVAALVGPIRFLEEAMLERRFGEEALRYRRCVPAYGSRRHDTEVAHR
jgi:protein-S-isoprenylcysteine O-methyltransferase Ste14